MPLLTLNSNDFEPQDYEIRKTVKAVIFNDEGEVLMFGNSLVGGGVEEGEWRGITRPLSSILPMVLIQMTQFLLSASLQNLFPCSNIQHNKPVLWILKQIQKLILKRILHPAPELDLDPMSGKDQTLKLLIKYGKFF